MKILKRLAVAASTLMVIVTVSAVLYIMFPTESDVGLPRNLKPFTLQDLKDDHVYSVDFELLSKHFEPQIYRSFCGVASSVTVLNTLNVEASQQTFFENPEAAKTRSKIEVFFTGMPLADLESLLKAYDVHTVMYQADLLSVDDFRQRIVQNAQNPNDFILVNYSRTSLNQEGGGHISPIGAYNPVTDEVLVLDVAAFKYPFTWIKTKDLFDAMNTLDGEKSRGFIEVFQ